MSWNGLGLRLTHRGSRRPGRVHSVESPMASYNNAINRLCSDGFTSAILRRGSHCLSACMLAFTLICRGNMPF
mgnify:CR=1 FL=1